MILFCILISIFTREGEIINSSNPKHDKILYSSMIVNSWFDFLSACQHLDQNIQSMKYTLSNNNEQVYISYLNDENFYIGILSKENCSIENNEEIIKIVF